MGGEANGGPHQNGSHLSLTLIILQLARGIAWVVMHVGGSIACSKFELMGGWGVPSHGLLDRQQSTFQTNQRIGRVCAKGVPASVLNSCMP